MYVSDPTDARILGKHVVELQDGDNAGFGPAGERFVWWQTTVKGGRETRDIDAIELAKVSEILGKPTPTLNKIISASVLVKLAELPRNFFLKN